MAKEQIRQAMEPWIEVAPSLLEYPFRPSNSPKLETIREESPKDYEDDDEDD